MKENKTSPEFFKIKIPSLSPKIIHSKNNGFFHRSNSLLNIKKMNSLSSRRTKYSNYYIFMKREIAFNKSVEKNKAFFKYQNYALFDRKKNQFINQNKIW